MLHTNKGSFSSLIYTLTTADTPEHLGGYMVADTISFTASTQTIADSGSGFLAKRFKAGDTLTISGSTDNDGTYTISTIVAGSIVVIEDLVDEVAGATVTVDATGRAKTQEIDNGVSVVVKGHPDNTSYIMISNSSDNALSTSSDHNIIYSNQSVSMQVQNLRSIWCNPAVSGEKVIVSFEK